MKITEYAFSDEPVSEQDVEMIEKYFDLPTREQVIGQLAPAQTVEDAIQRYYEVKPALRRQRELIVQALSMDGLITLIEYAAKLHGVDVWLDNEFLTQFEDTQPAYDEYKARCKRFPADIETQEAVNLAKAKAILGDRWLEGSVDARQWMSIVMGVPDAESYGPEVLREWSLYIGATEHLSAIELRNSLTVAIPPDAERVAMLEEIRRFIDNYTIGSPPPESIRGILEANFSNCWPEDRKLDEDWEKVLGVFNWHPFWEQFGPAFLEMRAAEAASKKEIGKKRAAAGSAGSKKRVWNLWIDYCQTFVEFAARREITHLLIESFPKQDGVSKAKGVGFLQAMLTARGDKDRRRLLWEPLEKIGILLPEDLIEECYAILFDGKIPQGQRIPKN